jgi:hypothetical protein
MLKLAMVLYLVQREECGSFFQSVSLLYSSDVLTHISLFLPFLLICQSHRRAILCQEVVVEALLHSK